MHTIWFAIPDLLEVFSTTVGQGFENDMGVRVAQRAIAQRLWDALSKGGFTMLSSRP